MQKVRWGILGAAKIAREWVCPGIQTSDRGVVAAVASRTPGKADGFAARYGARIHDELRGAARRPGDRRDLHTRCRTTPTSNGR